MPKVPVINAPRVEENLGTGIRDRSRAPAEMFGSTRSNVFNAAAGSIDKVTKAVVKAKKESDDLVIQEASLELKERVRDYTRDAKTKRGKNAFGASDEFQDFYKQSYDDIGKKYFNNSDQRNRFDLEVARPLKMSADDLLKTHEYKEEISYDDEKTKASIRLDSDLAADSYDNPAVSRRSIENIKKSISDFSERNGLPPESAKLELETQVSKAHINVVSRMLNDNKPAMAKAYIKNNGKELTTEDYDSIQKAMKESTFKADAQMKTSDIVGSAATESDALKMARQIADSDLQDEVIKRVKIRFNEKESAKKQASETNFDNAYRLLEEHKTLDQVPPSVIAALDLGQKQKLEKREEQLRNGSPTKTNLEAYYELELMAGNPTTRDMFSQLNLLNYRTELSESDFKKISGWQKNLRTGKGEKQLDGIESKNNIVNTALTAMDIDFSKKANEKDINKARLFRAEVDRLVTQKQETTGKRITNEELRDIVDNLSVEVVTNKNTFWFDETKKVFELNNEDAATISFEDVPLNERRKIEGALSAKGIPINEENILNVYSQKLNATRFNYGK